MTVDSEIDLIVALDPVAEELRDGVERLARQQDFGPNEWRVEEHGAPWCLFGSTVMYLHGIDLARRPSDIDVFVHPRIWTGLAALPRWELELPDPADPPFLRRHVAVTPKRTVDVCAFYRWSAADPEVNADLCRHLAQEVHGYWCAPLSLVRLHKVMAAKHGDSPRHAKHALDVSRIDVYTGFAKRGLVA